MGDDRILLILPLSLPDPERLEAVPATATLLKRLRSFLPVDCLIWPTLRGYQHLAASWRSGDDVDAYVKASVKPEHHTLDLTGSSVALLNVGKARSHTSVGVVLNAGTFAAWGEPSLATTSEAIVPLTLNPAQFLRAIMQGSDQGAIDEAVERAEATLDRGVLAHVAELFSRDLDLSKRVRLDIPVLYLETPMPFPSPPGLRLEIFRSMATNLRHDVLNEWPLRIQEEAGGYELADKVIPFIEQVIAER